MATTDEVNHPNGGEGLTICDGSPTAAEDQTWLPQYTDKALQASAQCPLAGLMKRLQSNSNAEVSSVVGVLRFPCKQEITLLSIAFRSAFVGRTPEGAHGIFILTSSFR